MCQELDIKLSGFKPKMVDVHAMVDKLLKRNEDGVNLYGYCAVEGYV